MKINTLYPIIYVMTEGIEASGKTTQFNLAKDYFEKKDFRVMSTRQPGGTKIGQKIRQILLDPENTELHPDAELLLYMADRTQHMKQMIIPYLHNKISLKEETSKKICLQDRGQFASKTYQGYGRGFNFNQIDWLHNNIAVGEYHPDSVLFFDITIEEMEKRLLNRNKQQGTQKDRLEQEDKDFWQRVRYGMHECKKQHPDLITIINAERSIEEIHKDVVSHIEELVHEKNKLLGLK